MESHNAKLCQSIADGENNPFWTIEAVQEHINMLWSWYRKQGYEVPPIENGKRQVIGSTGDFDHELVVIGGYVQNILDMLSALMPDLYKASDGDTEALSRLEPFLKDMRDRHESRWQQIHNRATSFYQDPDD